VSTSSLGPDDVRAAAEVHAELGPAYRDAVLESFLERVNKEIDTRVDQRLAAAQQPQPPTPAPPVPAPQPPSPGSRQLSAWLPIVSIALGIPITAIIFKLGQVSSQTTELVWVWIAIAVINVAYVLGHRRPPSRG
jgi:hypothetical protein